MTSWLFLALLMVGVLWPVVAAMAMPCGKCCKEASRGCGTMPGSFSLCCLNSKAQPPTTPAIQVALVPGGLVEPLSSASPLRSEPRPVFHVPLLT